MFPMVKNLLHKIQIGKFQKYVDQTIKDWILKECINPGVSNQERTYKLIVTAENGFSTTVMIDRKMSENIKDFAIYSKILGSNERSANYNFGKLAKTLHY